MVFVGYTDSNTIYVLDGSKGDLVAYDTINGNLRAFAADPITSDIYALRNIIHSPTLVTNNVYRIFTFYNTPTSNTTIQNQNDLLLAIAVNPTLQEPGKDQYKVVYGIGVKGNIYILHSNSSGLKLVNPPIMLNKTTNLNFRSITFNPKTNMIYVTGSAPNLVYTINATTNKLKTIQVRNHPEGVAVDPNTNMIYVANSAANSVSAISGKTGSIIINITVGGAPTGIVVNPNTNKIYVANALSGTISVIDGKTNKLMAGVDFNVNPSNSGFLKCNGQRVLSNFTSYDVSSQPVCEAVPNPGFTFSSWSSDLLSNSSNSLSGVANPNNNSTIQFIPSHYGKLTANFITYAPFSLPPAFWAAVSAIITSFFIPSIVSWVNNWIQRRNLRKYLHKIDSDHNKLSKETMKKEIQNLYAKGKLSESHYELLKERISEYF